MNDEARKQAYEAEEQRIAETVSHIAQRIAAFSGNGGLGKTTVSVNLAFCFQMVNCSTGILNADITGPNVPKMLGINEEPIFLNDMMLPFENLGVKMIPMATTQRT